MLSYLIHDQHRNVPKQQNDRDRRMRIPDALDVMMSSNVWVLMCFNRKRRIRVAAAKRARSYVALTEIVWWVCVKVKWLVGPAPPSTVVKYVAAAAVAVVRSKKSVHPVERDSDSLLDRDRFRWKRWWGGMEAKGWRWMGDGGGEPGRMRKGCESKRYAHECSAHRTHVGCCLSPTTVVVGVVAMLLTVLVGMVGEDSFERVAADAVPGGEYAPNADATTVLRVPAELPRRREVDFARSEPALIEGDEEEVDAGVACAVEASLKEVAVMVVVRVVVIVLAGSEDASAAFVLGIVVVDMNI